MIVVAKKMMTTNITLAIENYMYLPTLYKKDKRGTIRIWNIWTDDNTIFTSHGQQDGQMQIAEKKVVGKNIGRSNETTPSEQADLTASSMWRKQLDKGYVDNLNKVDEIIYLPMLATDFEKRKSKVKYPVDIQPKLDGVRCLAMWDGNKIILLSRKGKKYKVAHVSEELESIIQPNMILDGEIYLHGATFQEVSRLVKKHRPGESEQLQYWVYDILIIGKETTEWFERHKMLTQTITTNSKTIKITPTRKAYGEREVYKMQQDCVVNGFEGAIVREIRAPYEVNHRSNHLLKVKDFKDAEYRIIGFTEGVGKFIGCVIWQCITEDKIEFNVVPKGTLKQKKQWFQEGEKHIGSWLKVKFFELSEDNVPRFPVGLGVRLPQDM